jgi:apolipoprotein N-acyltransferase
VVLQTATTTFQGTGAQEQHASLGALRAVESGRPVVHAAVSGVSSVFDAEGHRLVRLDEDETGVWVTEVSVVAGRTPYVRFGDWVPVGAVLVLVGTALVAGLRAARRAPAGMPPPDPAREGRADGPPDPTGDAPTMSRRTTEREEPR